MQLHHVCLFTKCRRVPWVWVMVWSKVWRRPCRVWLQACHSLHCASGTVSVWLSSSPASFGVPSPLVPFLFPSQCPVYIKLVLFPRASSPRHLLTYVCLSPPLVYNMCTNVPYVCTQLCEYSFCFFSLPDLIPSFVLSSPSSLYVYLPPSHLSFLLSPPLPPPFLSLSHSFSPSVPPSFTLPPFLLSSFPISPLHLFLPSFPSSSSPTSPTHSLTHWKQDLFMIDTPISVKKGDMLDGVICIQRNKLWRRHLKVHISYTHSPISSDSVPQVMDERVLS